MNIFPKQDKETYPKYDRSKSTLRKKPKNYKLDK